MYSIHCSVIGSTPGLWVGGDAAGEPIASSILVWMNCYHDGKAHVRGLQDPHTPNFPPHLDQEYAANLDNLMESYMQHPYINPKIEREVNRLILTEQEAAGKRHQHEPQC